MKTAFRQSFARDLKKIKDKAILRRVSQAIEEVEAAESLRDLANAKKLTGGDNFYRLRIGDYRIGFVVQVNTVEFVRCLPRRELYRYFP